MEDLDIYIFISLVVLLILLISSHISSSSRINKLDSSLEDKIDKLDNSLGEKINTEIKSLTNIDTNILNNLQDATQVGSRLNNLDTNIKINDANIVLEKTTYVPSLSISAPPSATTASGTSRSTAENFSSNYSLVVDGNTETNNLQVNNNTIITGTLIAGDTTVDKITPKSLEIKTPTNVISTTITNEGILTTNNLIATSAIRTPVLILDNRDLMKLLKSQSMTAGFCITTGMTIFPLYVGSFTFDVSTSINNEFDTRFINSSIDKKITKLYINRGFKITAYNNQNTATTATPVLITVFENTDSDVPKLFDLERFKFDSRITQSGVEALPTAPAQTSVNNNIKAYKAEYIGY
jgi:hypothetical protein